jgi:two-component system cell cycle response regulator
VNILIADSDPVVRHGLEMDVVSLGHACLVACNGLEAWELFQSHECDVIISDWMMPGLTGVELCERVRANPRTSYTFFVLLSGAGDRRHYAASMEAGADDCMSKPLDRDYLRLRLITAERVTSLQKQLAVQTRELVELNRRLFEEGRTDPLTRLRNRLSLRDDVAVLEDRVRRYGHFYALGMCDIDFYKKYNDTYGHQAGDEVLAKVADTLDAQSRDGDLVYRYGGEEFLVILPEQSAKTAWIALNRMRAAIQALAIEHGESTFQRVTISVGIAGIEPGKPKSFADLLAEADHALYLAKSSGRNTLVIFDEQVHCLDGSSTGTPA